MSTVWKSEDEDICIMERPTSRYFYMRVKRPDNGKWVQKSSKRTSVEAAVQEAIKWQAVMGDRIKRGVSATSVPFKVLCEKYIEEIDAEIARNVATDGQEGRNLKDLRGYKTIVRRYILPHIGETDIESVGRVAVQDLIEKRRVYWVSGDGKDIEEIEYERAGKTVRRPARHELASVSALTKFGVVLQRHLDIAVELKLIDETAVPPIKIKKASKAQRNRKGGRQPRSKFEIYQYKALLEYMPNWCMKCAEDPRLKRWAMHRLLLCDIVRFLGATGIRPGTESDFIRWKHIQYFDDKRGLDLCDSNSDELEETGVPRFVVTLPKGKIGGREAAGGMDALVPLYGIWRRYCDYHAGITDREDYLERYLYGGEVQGVEPLPESPDLEIPNDYYVFSLPDGSRFKQSSWRKTFNKLMQDFAAETVEGETHDLFGRKLVSYSLRHSWITWQLQAGELSIHNIATQVGSETDIIEQYYDKVEVKSLAHKHVSVWDME